MSLADNPRAVPGHNVEPDYAQQVSDRLLSEYAEMIATVERLLQEARDLPDKVDDDATAGRLAKVVKDFRDLNVRLRDAHDAEKQPYLRSCDAVDGFFFALMEKCLRRKRTDRPGGADVLLARIGDWQERKEAAERVRREEQARLAREAEAKANAEREERERLAREAEERAARARKPENVVSHEQEASEHRVAAGEAKAAEFAAGDAATLAEISSKAKPADLVRARHDDGVMTTSARESYAEVTDHSKLDPVALWPYISNDAKEKAVRQWARMTNYQQAMPGVEIGQRKKAVVR